MKRLVRYLLIKMPQTAQQVANEIGSKERRFFAMDEDSRWYSYSSKPIKVIAGSVWVPHGVDDEYSNVTEKFQDIHPKPNWRDSLVEYREKH